MNSPYLEKGVEWSLNASMVTGCSSWRVAGAQFRLDWGFQELSPHSPAGIARSSYHTCCRISLLHQNSPSEWVYSHPFYLRLEIELVEACNTALLCAVAEFNNWSRVILIIKPTDSKAGADRLTLKTENTYTYLIKSDSRSQVHTLSLETRKGGFSDLSQPHHRIFKACLTVQQI